MTVRQKVFEKYNGRCAYTGKQLIGIWEIDHAIPKHYFIWDQTDATKELFNIRYNVNDIENLLPSLKIVNHYKRGYTVEQFRQYMMNFHVRLSKLPKNPKVERSIRRKCYMLKVAEAFDITVDKPFLGKFYFELI